MEEEKNNIELLIKIILYLLLAMAFFSNYAVKSDTTINFIITIAFLFGILALIFLYIGLCSKTDYLKVFGYVLSGSFILVLSWFILNVLTPMKEGTRIMNLLNLLKAETIWIALLVPSIILILYMIIKEIKKKFSKHF